MKDIISKITSYDLFNNLLPGVVFVYLAENFTKYTLIQENLLVGGFLYYFIGILISRVGSLFIESFLRKIKFINFIDYKKYTKALKKDAKIEILSEQNNMYRTFISMLILLFLVKLYEYISIYLGFLEEYKKIIILIILFLLFMYSYRKQTNYIVKRVKLTK